MNQNTTPAAPVEPAFDATKAFDQLISGADASGPLVKAAPAAAPSGDPLVEQLRGDVPPADVVADPPGDATAPNEGAGEDTDVAPDVFTKLRKANKDAGTARNKLGDERKEWAEERAQLTARLTALETGRPPTQQPKQDDVPIEVLSGEQVATFMGSIDSTFEATKDDFVTKKEAAAIGVNAAFQALQAARGEIGSVAGVVQSTRFDQELGQLGIERSQFDTIWNEPGYAWGANLSDDQRLAALKSQAGISGSRPSQAAGQPPQPERLPHPGVDPRKHIETSQSPGSAQNPTSLRGMSMHKALNEGNMGAASRAATPLFEQLLQGAK